MVKRTGVVGHKSLSTKRLVVESLSDIETSNFKALLTYHFLMRERMTPGTNKDVVQSLITFCCTFKDYLISMISN